MLGFFEFLFQNLVYIVLFFIVGIIMGLVCSLGDGWSEKFKHIGVAVLIYGFILGPLVARSDYSDYKRHYITCEKYEAKQAGYIFHDDRCYKPVNGTQYIKVNDTLKTKKELQNG